jgi:hypothetical protein
LLFLLLSFYLTVIMATTFNNSDDSFVDIDDFDSDDEGADVREPDDDDADLTLPLSEPLWRLLKKKIRKTIGLN